MVNVKYSTKTRVHTVDKQLNFLKHIINDSIFIMFIEKDFVGSTTYFNDLYVLNRISF